MNRLITIPFSHFCEKARWGLDLARRAGRLSYLEEGHLPFFSRRATKKHGGRQVPLLVTADGVIGDSTDILKWVDGRLPADAKLYPSPEALEVEESLDARFGPDVRRVAYFHLMAEPKNLAVFFGSAPVPPLERRLMGLSPLRSVAFGLMRKGLGLDAARVERSTARIFETLTAMDKRLERSPYLAGTTFTAADLTFASLAGPLVMPPQYPLGWPAPDTLPHPLRELVARALDTRSGQHVLAMYARHR